MFVTPAYRAGTPGAARRRWRHRRHPDPADADPAAGGDLLAPDLPAAAEAPEGAAGDAVGDPRGDTVVTTGGIVGKVTKAVDGEDLEVEIAQGVKVKLVRGMISDVRSKAEPVNDNKPA